MAATLNTARPAARTYARPQDDSWKAQGFINFSIVRPDGTQAKLGAIPLKDSRNSERTLREWLSANPEKNAAKLLSALVITYRDAESDGPAMDYDQLGAAPEKK